jgi:hypothetical protein
MEIEAEEIVCGEYHEKGTGEESDQRWWAKVTYECSCGRCHTVYTEGVGGVPEPMEFPVEGKCGTVVVVIPYR